MTLNQGHRRLFVPLVCAATILFCGCHKTGRTEQAAASADAKTEIYKFLAKKSGQKEFKPGVDLELPKQLATLRSNANSLEQRTATVRASLRASEEQTPLQKEIESLRNELANVKREAGEARTRLKEAEDRVPPDAKEIAARQQESAAKDRAWTVKREELSAKDAQWEAELPLRKQKRAAIEKELAEAERAWALARAEVSRSEHELSRQENTYIAAIRQQVSEVRSYEALYQLIGEQLTTADHLLADPEISRRRIGLSFAREACSHANSDPEDIWLAARICEAYFWPNLDLADSTPGSRERALDLLERCRRIFFVSNETNNVLKNYALLMSNAPNARAADTFRVQLADWMEERGNLQRASEVLSEIRDAEVLAANQERVTRVKERVENQR